MRHYKLFIILLRGPLPDIVGVVFSQNLCADAIYVLILFPKATFTEKPNCLHVITRTVTVIIPVVPNFRNFTVYLCSVELKGLSHGQRLTKD